MTYSKILIFVVFLFSFVSTIQSRNITKLEIRRVDFSIESVISVDSSRFEKYFRDELKSVLITDTTLTNKFQLLIEQLKLDPKQYRPDVRAQIQIFWSDGVVDILSMSNLGIEINGKTFLINNELVRFVENSN